MEPNEDQNCYVSPVQRSILKRLAEHPVLRDQFFLTGGTALSVFYLHHRRSDDLDLFTTETPNLAELSFWIQTTWPGSAVTTRSTTQFVSMLIEQVRVDLIVDSLSSKEERKRVDLNGLTFAIDTLSNIGTNKLRTIVSRTEPKDVVDFYVLLRSQSGLQLKLLLDSARKREALFEDPPTAAFQAEETVKFFLDHPELRPEMILEYNTNDLIEFYEQVVRTIGGTEKRVA